MSTRKKAKPSRALKLPADVSRALKASPDASAVWQTQSDSHQREYLFWVQESKAPETRTRRIALMVKMLSARNPKKN